MAHLDWTICPVLVLLQVSVFSQHVQAYWLVLQHLLLVIEDWDKVPTFIMDISMALKSPTSS